MEESRPPAAAAMAVAAAPTTAADPCASADDATIANILRLARAFVSSTNDKANQILNLLKTDLSLPTGDGSVRPRTQSEEEFDRCADMLLDLKPPELSAAKPAQLERWLERLDKVFKMARLDGWDRELRTRWATCGLLKHPSLKRAVFSRLEDKGRGELLFDEFVGILRDGVKLPSWERTKFADELYNTPMRLGTPYREYLVRVQHLQAQLDYPLKGRALIDFIVKMLPDLYREKLPMWSAAARGDMTETADQFHDCVHKMEQACCLLDHAPPQPLQTSGASGRKRRRAAVSRDRGSAPALQPKHKHGGRVEKRSSGKGSERSKSAKSRGAARRNGTAMTQS